MLVEAGREMSGAEEPRQRRRRADAGTVRQTPRDAAALEWLSQMYGCPLDLLAVGLGVQLPGAREVTNRWRRAGWAEVAKVDLGPLWVWPTQATARAYLGWDAGYWRPRPTTTAHTRAVAEVRLWLQQGLTPEGWISDRMLRHEASGGRPRERGQKLPHVPDGVWTAPDGRRWAIEVELTPKSEARTYEALMQASNRAHQEWRGGVLYVVTEAARPVVEAARARLAHPESVEVRPIEQVRAALTEARR